jgi:tetratricopeptide (TPR) repeat protein
MKKFIIIFFFLISCFDVLYPQDIKELLRVYRYDLDMKIVTNAVNTKNYSVAFRKIDSMITRYPSYITQLNEKRAKVKLRIGDTLGALQDYDICVQNEPEEFYFYQRRGMIKMDQKNYAAALLDFQSATKLTADWRPPLLYFYQGMAKVLVNDFGGGIKDLSFSIDSTENSNTKVNYSELLKAFFLSDDDNDLTESNLADAYCFRGFARISLKELGLGCADLLKAKALGHSFAKELLKRYCNN